MKSTSIAEIAGHEGRTIARNTIYNLLGRGLPLLVGLFTTPFVVRGLGEARFGLFSIGLALISSFFMFDLGLGRAVAKFAAAYRAGGREKEIPSLVWNAVYAQLGIGVVVGGVMAAMTPSLVERVLAIPPELVAEATMVFYLLAATTVVCLTEFSLAGVLEAYQRFGLINAARAPINIIGLLFILWVAMADRSLSHFFAFFLGSRVALAGCLLCFCGQVVPGFFRGCTPSLTSARPLIHFGKWVTVSNLVAPALLYADRFLLGTIGSLGQVAFYAAPFQVLERLLIIPGTLTSTLFPAVSALDSAQSKTGIQRLSARAMHYMVCLMGTGGVVLVASAPWVVWLFFGEPYLEHSVPVFRILVAGICINALAFIPYTVVQGCGHPDITAKLHLIEVPIHLALVYLGYVTLGLSGVALAWTIRVSLDCGLLVYVGVRRGWIGLEQSRSLGTARNVVVYVLAGALFSSLPWGAEGWQIGLAAAGVVTVVAYTLCLGLGPEQRVEVWHFIRRKPHVDEGI